MQRRFISIVWLVFAVMAVPLAASFGCGGGSWTYNLTGSQRDPGSDGTVQVERIEGGNRLVTVHFRHLTPPERLGGGLTIFVLWFRDAQGHSTKASVLAYEPDSRTARATATTPMTSFQLVVTAERNNTVAEPSENVIFNQRVRAE
jgi:hypothetical protein